MKITLKHFNIWLLLLLMIVASCDDELIEANKNPDVLPEVTPENQFLSGAIGIHGQDFEAYYDFYRRIMPWMQYVTPLNGNPINFTNNIDNFSQRYSRLYTGVGDALTDVEFIVERMPEEERGRFVHMIDISRILKAYYTFYVSDIYGSLPYQEAWQGRYGGTLTPGYESQQEIFDLLDADIKASIQSLKTTPGSPQVSLGNYDPYYKGNVESWIRAANALRLKIATRLIKRDPSKAGSIAAEVLAEGPDNLMTSNAQGWQFVAGGGFLEGGNFNPDGLFAGKPIVDFMWDYNDPRIDAFFSKNTYSQDTIDVLIDADALDEGTMEAQRRYFGSFTSPDAATDDDNAVWYNNRTASVGDTQVRVDTLSLIQRRLFQPTFNEGNGPGTGLSIVPVITFAEFCFIRAEFAARGLTSENTEELYNAGVTASIQWYDQIARAAELSNYSPLEDDEIVNYLMQTDIAFDESRALDQIASQAYLHYFRQPAEAWALWKRTGYPNTTSVVPIAEMRSNGAVLGLPRRAPLPLLNETSANFENQQAAYAEMAQESGFGAGPTDAFGRVWWDVEE